jgi:hypothetical protein
MSDVPKSGLVKMSGRPDRSYPTLADVHTVTRPVLAKHGLCVVQDVLVDGDWVRVLTTLIHSSGEKLGFGPIGFPAGRDPQATGSSVTYARRYGLLAALGLAGEDDDGASAASRPEQQVVPAPSPRPRGGAAPPGGTSLPPRGGVPSGSSGARQAKTVAAAISRAEEWRARVKALPAGPVRAGAAKVFTDAGATPGVELSGEQAVVVLGGLKRHEARIVLLESERDNPPADDLELFDDGPPLDDEGVTGE